MIIPLFSVSTGTIRRWKRDEASDKGRVLEQRLEPCGCNGLVVLGLLWFHWLYWAGAARQELSSSLNS